jgi:hypothetical protein
LGLAWEDLAGLLQAGHAEQPGPAARFPELCEACVRTSDVVEIESVSDLAETGRSEMEIESVLESDLAESVKSGSPRILNKGSFAGLGSESGSTTAGESQPNSPGESEASTSFFKDSADARRENDPSGAQALASAGSQAQASLAVALASAQALASFAADLSVQAASEDEAFFELEKAEAAAEAPVTTTDSCATLQGDVRDLQLAVDAAWRPPCIMPQCRHNAAASHGTTGTQARDDQLSNSDILNTLLHSPRFGCLT